MADDTWTYPRVLLRRVVDGDTLDLNIDCGLHTHRVERVRLARINAPEMNTDAGKAAKAWLENKLLSVIFSVRTIKDRQEKYGRYLAEVFIGLENVNDAMVAAGHAVYKEYSTNVERCP